jgi:hypothetical protein
LLRFHFAAFLLNHSPQYHTALVAGWLEYVIEYFAVPSLKSQVRRVLAH